MLLCAGGSLVSAIIVGYFASLIASRFSLNVRKKIFNKVSDNDIHTGTNHHCHHHFNAFCLWIKQDKCWDDD